MMRVVLSARAGGARAAAWRALQVAAVVQEETHVVHLHAGLSAADDTSLRLRGAGWVLVEVGLGVGDQLLQLWRGGGTLGQVLEHGDQLVGHLVGLVIGVGVTNGHQLLQAGDVVGDVAQGQLLSRELAGVGVEVVVPVFRTKMRRCRAAVDTAWVADIQAAGGARVGEAGWADGGSRRRGGGRRCSANLKRLSGRDGGGCCSGSCHNDRSGSAWLGGRRWGDGGSCGDRAGGRRRSPGSGGWSW